MFLKYILLSSLTILILTIDCPQGTFINGDSCSPCPSGTWNWNVRDHCTGCGSGQYLSNGQCYYCDKGTYNTDANAVSCLPCPTGTSNWNVRDHCTGCGTGMYLGNDGNCYNCDKGTYNTDANAVSCLPCPTGTSNWNVRDHCTGCGTGMYLGDNGNCYDCPAGTYNTDQNAVQCQNCPAGQWNWNQRGYCAGCGTGQYLSNGACYNCDQGTYNPNDIATSCLACPSGTWNWNQRVWCGCCDSGQYLFNGKCYQCTSNYQCTTCQSYNMDDLRTDMLTNSELQTCSDSIQKVLSNFRYAIKSIAGNVTVSNFEQSVKDILDGDITDTLGNLIEAGSITTMAIDQVKNDFVNFFDTQVMQVFPELNRNNWLDNLAQTKFFTGATEVLDKVGLVYSYAVPIGVDQINDFKNHQSISQHLSDIFSDSTLTWMTMEVTDTAATAIGAAVFGGAAIPTACAGFAIGLGVTLITDSIVKVNDKTPVDYYKQYVNQIFGASNNQTTLQQKEIRFLEMYINQQLYYNEMIKSLPTK